MLLFELRADQKGDQREDDVPTWVQINGDVEDAADADAGRLVHFSLGGIIANPSRRV